MAVQHAAIEPDWPSTRSTVLNRSDSLSKYLSSACPFPKILCWAVGVPVDLQFQATPVLLAPPAAGASVGLCYLYSHWILRHRIGPDYVCMDICIFHDDQSYINCVPQNKRIQQNNGECMASRRLLPGSPDTVSSGISRFVCIITIT